MPDNNVWLIVIAVCQIIMTLAGAVAVAALVYAVFAFKNLFNNKIDEVMERIQPVIDRAESIAQQAKDTADNLSDRVEHIASRAESTADTVTHRFEAVSGRVDQAANPQVMAVAGIIGTVLRLVQLYKDVSHSHQTTTPAGRGAGRNAGPCCEHEASEEHMSQD